VTAAIHPTATVSPDAEIGPDVTIGPGAIVGAGVRIGRGTSVGANANVQGPTTIGEENRIFPFAVVGFEPQDLKYRGEDTRLTIGNRNVFREFSTVHRGTAGGRGETVVGDENLFMAYCHVAHDCRIGDHLVAANTLNLAGHVELGHHVNIGGTCAITQFRKVGDYCHLSAYSLIIKDVAPFAITAPGPMRVVGINRIGLSRAGFSEERRRNIKRAYKILFRSGLTATEACARLSADFTGDKDVEAIIAFVKSSTKGLLRMTEREDQEEGER